MASEGGHSNDPTARRRRITEKGSDRLALITGGRTSNPPTCGAPQSLHSSDESCPPSLTGESDAQPVSGKSESTKIDAISKHQTISPLKIYLHKTISPNRLQPAILASQDTRRKCSFLVGIVAVLSHVGFPILGSYVVRSIILWRPLVLLLFINVSITVGPLLLDVITLIQQEASEEKELLADNVASPFEWGMLFKTGFCAFFMDSCIYSVVVVCATSFFQKFGL